MVGIETCGFHERRQGQSRRALVDERQPEAIVRGCKVGPERHGGALGADSLVRLAGRASGDSEIVQQRGVVRDARRGLSVNAQRLSWPAGVLERASVGHLKLRPVGELLGERSSLGQRLGCPTREQQVQDLFEAPPPSNHGRRIQERVRAVRRNACRGHVTERAESIGGFRCDRARRGRDGRFLGKRSQSTTQSGHQRLTRRGQILLLAGIPFEIVELDLVGLNQFPAVRHKRCKRAPACGPWVSGLAVHVSILRWCFGEEVRAIEAGWHIKTREPEHGREQIDEADGLVADGRRDVRRAHDEGHAKGSLVEQHAVRPFAVLAKTLTMIAGHDDD